MNKLLTSVCLLSLVFSLPALAGKEEKVREILKLSHQDKAINTVLSQQIFIPMECNYVIPETEKSTVKKEVVDAINIKSLTEPIVQLYSNEYTESELDELIRFYKTPTGKKSLEVNMKLAVAVPQLLQRWMEQNFSNIQKVGEELNKKYPQRSGNEIQACIQKYQQ